MQNEQWRFDTRSIHCGKYRDEKSRALNTPIFQTSTFEFPDAASLEAYHRGETDSYIYTRYGNPTQEAAEKTIASLEGGEACLVLSSGMAAITTTLITLAGAGAGDKVVAFRDVYGRVHQFLTTMFPRYGVDVELIQVGDYEKLSSAIDERTKVIYLESPTNPLTKIVDIERVVSAAETVGAKVVIDNTFATPVNQRPLELGVDVVVHSATKYLNGHSDLIAGAIIGKFDFIKEARETLKTLGGALDPLGAYLLLRGIKTLGVRVARHNENAMAVAKFLESHSKVEQAFYPGLPSHPQHELAKKQMSGFGGMVSFEIKGGKKAGETLLENTRVFSHAASLGGVESLISMPITMSHHTVPEEARLKSGITGGIVRLSVGIENVEDIIGDLEQAMGKC